MILLNKKDKKRSLSLTSKIIALTIFAVFVSSLVATSISLYSMSGIVEMSNKSAANSSVNVLQNEMRSLQENARLSVSYISINHNVSDALQSGNATALLSEMKKLTSDMKFDAVIVTDKNGNVFSSTNAAYKTGSSLSGEANIKSALAGKNYTGYLTGSGLRFAVLSSSPIYSGKDGSLTGTVTAAYSLENNQLLDSLKADTGNEFTIFIGNERLNTTIIQDGKRAVGTKLGEAVSDIVINKKQLYLGEAQILGENYATAYVPIMSSDGASVIGILFSGSNLSALEKSERMVQYTAFGASIILIVIFTLIGILFLRSRLKKPLDKVVTAAQAIESGTMDDSTVKLLGTIKSRDEIGRLAGSMQQAINSISKVVSDIGMLSDAVSRNDLTVQIDSSAHNGKYKDITVLVDGLVSELGSLIKNVSLVSGRISSGSELISAGSQTLAQGSTEQAAAIEEISATSSHIVEKAKNNSKNANQSRGMAEKVQKEAELGSEKMQRLFAALEEISASSKNISTITKAIEEIAFQTNILSLNAAVEAAHAGALGKGFAIVAGEVKRLAEKSSEAARQTNLLVGTSIVKSKDGTVIGQEMQHTLNSIVSGINEAVESIKLIALESTEQVDAIEQLNSGIGQISQVVLHNTATAEESSSSSVEMASQAKELDRMIAKFKF